MAERHPLDTTGYWDDAPNVLANTMEAEAAQAEEEEEAAQRQAPRRRREPKRPRRNRSSLRVAGMPLEASETDSSAAERPPASSVERTPSSGYDGDLDFGNAAASRSPSPSPAAPAPPSMLEIAWQLRRAEWLKCAFGAQDPRAYEAELQARDATGDWALWVTANSSLADLCRTFPGSSVPAEFEDRVPTPVVRLLWVQAETMAAHALSHILGRQPRVCEVHRMCDMALEGESSDLAVYKVWIASSVSSQMLPAD